MWLQTDRPPTSIRKESHNISRLPLYFCWLALQNQLVSLTYLSSFKNHLSSRTSWSRTRSQGYRTGRPATHTSTWPSATWCEGPSCCARPPSDTRWTTSLLRTSHSCWPTWTNKGRCASSRPSQLTSRECSEFEIRTVECVSETYVRKSHAGSWVYRPIRFYVEKSIV